LPYGSGFDAGEKNAKIGGIIIGDRDVLDEEI